MDDLVTTQEAAELAGVGTSTIKRWADEGRLECVKTPGGHRRYGRASVLKVLGTETSFDDWFRALEDTSEYEAVARLMSLRGKLGHWAAVADALAPLINEIGLRWERGQLSIIDEHCLSDRLLRALRKALDVLPIASRAPKVLLACARGDQHTFGLALCELVLREAGYATLWAGLDTPTSELVTRVSAGDIRAVVLSASVANQDRKGLAEQARAVEHACSDAGAWLFVGGRGAWPAPAGNMTAPASFSVFREALRSLAEGSRQWT